MVTKISVFCIFRNSEAHLARLFKQLEDLESLAGFEFSFFFYENDSTDNTAVLLGEWLDKRNGGFLSEKLNVPSFGSVVNPERMKLLCECRNKCKELSGTNDSKYSLLIDSDILFNIENFLTQIQALETLDDAVMVTPNVRQEIPDYTFELTQDSYYDVYPFRDRHGNTGMYFTDCPSYKKQDQFDWKLGKPIEAMAAFGGFAVVRSEVFNIVSWSADINCDHVNLCFDISKFGIIYIHPRSKVYVDDVGEYSINVDGCKQISKQQFHKYQEYF